MRTLNGKVAVKPFQNMTTKAEAKGTGTIKVGIIEAKSNLVELEVVYDAEGVLDGGQGFIFKGDRVYVRGSHFTAAFAKEIHNLDGIDFILIPLSIVELTKSRHHGIPIAEYIQTGPDELPEPIDMRTVTISTGELPRPDGLY